MLTKEVYIFEDGVMADFICQSGQAVSTQKILSDILDESMWIFWILTFK